ncbi:MAG: hypothetical protein LBL21_03280 [Rickettsiales bacterium]|jgi:hypothetical protein|nr:hypothetical protein [Rickettsiales bacterium]
MKINFVALLPLFASLSANAAVPYNLSPYNGNRGRSASFSALATVGATSAQQPALGSNLPSSASASNDIINEIRGDYQRILENARNACSGIAGGIDKIKIAAGVGIGAGAVGTLAGGAAVVSGVMKAENDKKIDELNQKLKQLSEGSDQELMAAFADGSIDDALSQLETELAAAEKKSQTLGTVRTVGSFVSGGTQAVGAASSFIGLRQLDELADNMDKCNKAVKEIDNLRLRAQIEIPDESATIADMARITNGCGRLDSGNIRSIKGQLTASGVIMAVGGVLGVAGGATSAVAGGKEKAGASAVAAGKDGGTKELNTASNVLAGASAATALAGTIISGVTLAGLMKNGDIAKKCEEVF